MRDLTLDEVRELASEGHRYPWMPQLLLREVRLRKELQAERDKLREELETVRAVNEEQLASTNRLRTERDTLSDALGAAYLLHEQLTAQRQGWEADAKRYAGNADHWRQVAADGRIKLHHTLSTYHALALANGQCGDTLDTRCWACGQIEHERMSDPDYPQAPRAKR